MTPTRTDTTLRQGRRTFKHISLNNTRPRLHSLDATRTTVGPAPPQTAASHVNNEQESSNTMCGDHTREQIINWVMSKDAVASCFIKDVLSMSESERGGLPYYLLGRVPCRSVSFVAIVVGAVAYERRIVYTLDDGTGTIECPFRPDEDKPEDQTSENRNVAPLAREVAADKLAAVRLRSPLLIPVGSVVKVQGKVRAKPNSRDIHGETIERCKGAREELEHWRQVTSLHKNYYFLPEKFIIPCSSATTAVGVQDIPHTPKSTRVVISTPSTRTTTSSSCTSSPAKSSDDPSLPPRLRHPSRLHSRDLTENTFRIYVKHFMDNLRYLNVGPQSCEGDLDSDTDSIAAAIDQMPATPTKQRPTPSDDRTPRSSHCTSVLTTPRPRPRSGRGPRLSPLLDRSSHDDEKDAVVGCTLSFLLRVPELAILASRVVRAELRRREKTRQSQSGAANPDSSRKHKALASSAEGSTPKVERLFSWAIRKLYLDGNIILWDGPVFSLPEPHTALDSSLLYRSSQLDNDDRSSSVSSRRISRHGTQLADYMEDLSDPPSDEEAYASLSTAYLATLVEQAIRSLTALQARRMRETENTFLGPAVSRRRLLPLPGPTKEDITTHLKRGDDRWKRITGWAVQEALEWLRDNDRVWCVSEEGGGRWELCS